MASSDDGRLLLYSILGFGAGIWTFFKGFRVFREYRVLADTPEVPIRSIAMGLVEIHGQAEPAGQLLTSPVTRTPCCLYQVQIERWEHNSKGSGGHWKHHRTDLQGAKFYLQDATGKVLVEPDAAELDLTESAQCEAGPGGAGLAGGASNEQLLQYVTEANVHMVTNFVGRGLEFVGPRSDPKKEAVRQNLMELFSHNPAGGDFQQRMVTMMAPKILERIQKMGPQSDPQKEQARLAAMEAFQHPPGSPEFQAHLQRAATLAPPEERGQLLAALGAMNHPGSAGMINFGSASGRYRLREFCIVPGKPYDITGTAVENPRPQDVHDRNLIQKGQNEPTFLISSRTEKEAEHHVRNRALKYVFGGAALAIACLAYILYKAGLF